MADGITRNPKVSIISDRESVRVTPGELFVAPKSIVTFENLGEGKVGVLFPDKSLFGTDTLVLETQTQDNLTVAVTEKGFFYYDVYNYNNQTSTNSSTRPIIIVYPES
ncbi:MAG TPA: hypothetical protein ENO22_13025 [candidate division Zixibacteria bacterium]|nr:hypothetical protein [candidate division Zixibacteria bacterium]